MSSPPVTNDSPNKDGAELTHTLFAASIHEIKNRFGLLLAQLESVLADPRVADAPKDAVAHIRHDAQFIGSELLRVLTVFKADSGQMTPHVDQHILEDVLEEVVARHATTSQATGCALSFACDSDLTGFFDLGIVTVVLDTCIYNALKAGASTIVLRASTSDGFLCVYVDDNGPGFPAGMLAEPVTSGNLKYEQGATGLGLYFANTLLAHHQEGEKRGSLLLGRSPEGGARVTLRLPE